MSDLRPFVSQEGDEGDLLRSALGDHASSEARERARAALTRAIAGGGGGGGGGGGAGPSVPPQVLRAGAGLAIKWIGAGAIATVAALALLASYALRHATPTSAAPPSPSMMGPVVASAPPDVPAAPTPVATVEESAAPPARTATARPAQSAAIGPSLADEVAALDEARRTLSRGDANGALAALDGYNRTFPRGVLRETASVLRVEALARSGNRAAAVALAQRLLRAHPKSPYAVKLRSLVPEVDTNP